MSINETQNQLQNKAWNPHVLNKEELARIPEVEKTNLVLMPGEKGSVWMEATTKAGKQYWYTLPFNIIEAASHFSNMLKDIEPTTTSHLVFGGFCFSMGKDRCMRSKYTENKNSYGSGGAKPQYVPKYVTGVFLGKQDEINDFLNQDGNKNKWLVYGDWKFDANHEPVIGLYKTS